MRLLQKIRRAYRNKNINNAIPGIVFGTTVGLLAWRPPHLYFLALWGLPFLWGRFNRYGKMLLMLTYLGVSLYPVTHTVTRFYLVGADWPGTVAWLACTLLLWLPWLACAFTKKYSALAWMAATIISALPPLGSIGMVSPLFGATALFPGWALWGLIATWGLQGALASTGSIGPARTHAIAGAVIMALVGALAFSGPEINTLPAGWHAMPTRLGAEPATPSRWVQRQVTLKQSVTSLLANLPTHSIVLTPEGITGTWGALSALSWSPVARYAKHRSDTILLGVTLQGQTGSKLDAFLALGNNYGVYSSRQPVPLGEWVPFKTGSFITHWRQTGPDMVGDTPVAFLICYEQLLIWPAAWAWIGPVKPQLILAPANHGWAGDGRTEMEIQRQAALALGRLFGVPVVLANNE